VSGLRERVAGLFVEPVSSEARIEAAAPVAQPPARWLPPVAPAPAVSAVPAPELVAEPALPGRRIAVIAAAGDAALAGAALGLGLVARRRGPCALLARWTGEEPARPRAVPATGAARRLSAALVAEGHAAHASGRLVLLDLPADEGEAVAAADRALRGATPGLLVVAGPRTDIMERALAACGALVLAAREAADPELLTAAATELEALGPPVATLRLGGAGSAAALCRAGLAVPAGLRAPVDETLAAAGVPA